MGFQLGLEPKRDKPGCAVSGMQGQGSFVQSVQADEDAVGNEKLHNAQR